MLGLGSLIAAHAVVRAASLMPVRRSPLLWGPIVLTPTDYRFLGPQDEINRRRSKALHIMTRNGVIRIHNEIGEIGEYRGMTFREAID